MRHDPTDHGRRTDASLPEIEGENMFDPPQGFDPNGELIADSDLDAGRPGFEWDVQQRLWLKAILPVLQLRCDAETASGRVQFAFDRMHITACERIGRILRTDLDHELR